MIRLLIIADDFTGALDTGVQFSERGIETKVVVGSDETVDLTEHAETVLVVDTETRHLPPRQAAGIVFRLVKSAAGLEIPYIFKKTDSALRGNIGAELSAALSASGRKQLFFLPAFPQIGRRTVNGCHLIDGVPVDKSVFGADPFEPVRHANVADLIGEQSGCVVHCSAPLREDSVIPDAPGILVFDSETEAELITTAKRLLDTKRLSLMAGCAGLGTVLARLLETGAGKPPALPKLDPRFLVVCGSVNPITVQQMEVAERHGFYHRRLSVEQKLMAGYWKTPAGLSALEELRGMIREHPLCIISANDAEQNQATAEFARKWKLDLHAVRQRIAVSLGTVVDGLFSASALGTLLVTGGDTLLQCMEQMGVHELKPICEIGSGVVLSQFRCRGRTGHIFSKSGGLGGKTIIVELADAVAQAGCPGPCKEEFKYGICKFTGTDQ